jgi:hypothetical protein
MTTKITCCCGYNLWSVDCGCIIRRSISSLKVSLWRITPFNKYIVLSSCGYFWTLTILCTSYLCVVAFSYFVTACHLVESSRSIYEETQNPQLNAHRDTAKIVVGLTVVFLISYVPCHTIWTYINFIEEVQFELHKTPDILDHSNNQFQYTYLISACSLLINSCLNPVALFSTSSPSRQHLKRCLTCCCKTNSPPKVLELTRRN